MRGDGIDRDTILDVLEAATRFAHEAGEITLRYVGGLVDHEAKGDGSPVTLADREAEAHIRKCIEQRWPEHGILGEEFGVTREGAPIRWILTHQLGLPALRETLATEAMYDWDAVVSRLAAPSRIHLVQSLQSVT